MPAPIYESTGTRTVSIFEERPGRAIDGTPRPLYRSWNEPCPPSTRPGRPCTRKPRKPTE